MLSLIGPSPYSSNFLSENDKLEAKYNEVTEVVVNVKNGNIEMKELHPLRAPVNGTLDNDKFWKDFDGVDYLSIDLVPNMTDKSTNGTNINEQNPRVGGDHVLQYS